MPFNTRQHYCQKKKLTRRQKRELKATLVGGAPAVCLSSWSEYLIWQRSHQASSRRGGSAVGVSAGTLGLAGFLPGTLSTMSRVYW